MQKWKKLKFFDFLLTCRNHCKYHAFGPPRLALGHSQGLFGRFWRSPWQLITSPGASLGVPFGEPLKSEGV